MSNPSTLSADRLTAIERRAAGSIAVLYALRMLGLFMILPVFALFAENLDGATPQWIGLAIGAYGLTQAALQVPFGLLSDRIGRKPVLCAGLLLFALGSMVAALADHILWVVVGRALQGAGAIAAVLMALAADLSREEQRSKVMAAIGLSIGLSFAAALVLGPLLSVWIGVRGIFWLTALSALLGIVWVFSVIPKPNDPIRHRDTETVPRLLHRVIGDPNLLRLDASIFLLHLTLTASFVAVPIVLRDQLALPVGQHWRLYLPALVLSLVFMVPAIIVAEKKRVIRPLLLAAIVLLSVAEGWLSVGIDRFAHALVLLVVFFTAVNFLEAILPSLVARFAPVDAKGTALGAYSTSQFLGAFTGGAGAGWCHAQFGLDAVFVFALCATVLWLWVAWSIASPKYLTTCLLRIAPMAEEHARQLTERLLQVNGVAEAVVDPLEGIAYLKIDGNLVDRSTLQALATQA